MNITCHYQPICPRQHNSGDTANFANRLMNENNENIKQEVLNSFNKSVQFIGVKTHNRYQPC